MIVGEDAVYNFVNSMVEESKCCSEVMKKHSNKEIIVTKKDVKDFEYSTKCWICENVFVDSDVKVTYHCRITGKYRDSAHIDCNIKVRLNPKILVKFYNLKNYDSHLNTQELCKLNFKMNAIPNVLEKIHEF